MQGIRRGGHFIYDKHGLTSRLQQAIETWIEKEGNELECGQRGGKITVSILWRICAGDILRILV